MRPSGNQLLLQALAISLKARRAELGLSQEDLAGRAELDRPFISLLEVARKQPTLSVMHRLAIALDLSLSEFTELIELRYSAIEVATSRARGRPRQKS